MKLELKTPSGSTFTFDYAPRSFKVKSKTNSTKVQVLDQTQPDVRVNSVDTVLSFGRCLFISNALVDDQTSKIQALETLIYSRSKVELTYNGFNRKSVVIDSLDYEVIVFNKDKPGHLEVNLDFSVCRETKTSSTTINKQMLTNREASEKTSIVKSLLNTPEKSSRFGLKDLAKSINVGLDSKVTVDGKVYDLSKFGL